MRKSLILVLAVAFVAAFSVAAFAAVQNVKVSGDLTVYGLARQLSLTSQKAETAMASIMRLRVDADLTDNVMATVRLINERYWGSADSVVGVTSVNGDSNTNIDIDLAYATMKEFLCSPLTLTIGRQELHFGNDMIVGAATTNNIAPSDSVFSSTVDPDLTMRKSFDAIRATLNYDPLVVDVVVAQTSKDFRIQPNQLVTTTESLSVDDQDTLMGVNVNYALTKTTDLEGYFWQKRMTENDKAAILPPVKKDTTDVLGARIVTKAIDALTFQLESAIQFGNSVDTTNTLNVNQKRRAWALETSLTYDWKKVKYMPSTTLAYAYFSGNRDSGAKVNSGWDPMFENQKMGEIANALFNQTNAHVLGGIITAKPMSDLMLKGEYYAYWWDKRLGSNNQQLVRATATNEVLKMTNKKFAAQEMDLTATYDYTEDVQFSLLGGLLLPGDSFNKENRGTAGEFIGSMKVTF